MIKTTDDVLHEHVIESNLIENIRDKKGGSYYEGHYQASVIADTGEIVHPNVLHEKLFSTINEPIAGGVYRIVDVYIGTSQMPLPQFVPELMKEWSRWIDSYIASQNGNFFEAAEFLHYWFACIHPYEDGNGRVSRIEFNMLLRNKGLPWYIVKNEDYHAYRARILKVEKVFKDRNPDVY